MNRNSKKSETVSLEQCAQQLGIGRATAYKLAKKNELPVPVIRVGTRYLIPRRSLDRLLEGEQTG